MDGKHYRVCMHGVIGRYLTPCVSSSKSLGGAASAKRTKCPGQQNFMLMASEADGRERKFKCNLLLMKILHTEPA